MLGRIETGNIYYKMTSLPSFPQLNYQTCHSVLQMITLKLLERNFHIFSQQNLIAAQPVDLCNLPSMNQLFLSLPKATPPSVHSVSPIFTYLVAPSFLYHETFPLYQIISTSTKTYYNISSFKKPFLCPLYSPLTTISQFLCCTL